VARPGESPRTVKAWPLTPLIALKLIAFHAQPQRHRRGAGLLRAAGVRTPELLAGPRLLRRNGTWLVEIELAHASGELALDAVRGASTSDQRAAIRRAIDRLLDQFHAAGLLNRDLKLSNLLFAPAAGGQDNSLEVVVLDPVGVRRTGDGHAARIRHEERLRVEDPAAWDRLQSSAD